MIEPLFNRVLLKRPIEDVSKGGIIIPNAKSHAESKGEILAVGPSADDSVKALIGKTVVFGRFAGDWLKDKETGVEYFLCNDDDLLGVVQHGIN